ncbi:OmpW family outer membrane protein [Halopseudomonas salina]|uniref:Outer membrane protein OprG n=1 Tax=Halopseudomonas salina TaxID=1323744 RepID=A0ABQ1Q326_9GAMM|nr:OmpW family outer membrane protein [Halopseudomonas salina]GGD12020.1 outer membrane protein OprG [Halopseudomonas salina]
MSRFTIQLAAGLLLAPALLAASVAQAHEAGDVIVRVGAAVVDPQESSSNVFVGGANTGLEVGVDSNTQLGITGTFMLTDNIGIGLLAATPFSHDIELKGAGRFASIKHLPPTVTLQYFPMAKSSAWQPYVGAGLNYTMFFSEDLSSNAEGAGFSSLDLDDSWGYALEAGMDYKLTEQVYLNAAVWYADIDTTANFRTAGIPSKVDVEIDPMVYMASIGYKF